MPSCPRNVQHSPDSNASAAQRQLQQMRLLLWRKRMSSAHTLNDVLQHPTSWHIPSLRA